MVNIFVLAFFWINISMKQSEVLWYTSCPCEVLPGPRVMKIHEKENSSRSLVVISGHRAVASVSLSGFKLPQQFLRDRLIWETAK